MEKVIYFDYCALVLLCILLLTTISRKMIHGKQNRFFLYVIIVVLLTTIADIFALNLNNMGSGHAFAKYFSHTLYLIAHMASTPFYVAYMFTLTDVWHRMHRHRILYIFAYMPFLIGATMILSSPFTHAIFYLNEAEVYTRGSYFYVLYIIAVIYAAWGIIHISLHRKHFSTMQFITLASILPALMGVAVVQYFLPDYMLEMFANVTALIFLSMMIQRPEDLLDSNTGLWRISAYVTNVRNASLTSKPMEIIMLNIVNFDILYEILGFQRTSSMLRNIANQLVLLNKKQNMGAEFYYLGQGKFRIVMDSSHFDKTADIAHIICQAMHPGFVLDQMAINLVTHVCIMKYPEDIDNIDSLLAFGSDLNNIPYTGEVMYASDLYRKEYYDIKKDIDRIIEEALIENKFEVYYQPIYSVAEGRFNSAEALLRLKTSKYGFISPELLIPAAEKNGAIHTIGKFVINEVCKFISSEEYKNLGIDYIEINLSVAQCMQNNLAKDILETLKKYHVHPSQINLEITETAASYSQKTMLENLDILKEAGISFSLDDFGTGYSNMRRIASLPLHIVKLDKSFTNIEENPKLMIVLENTIRMIKDMNLKIVVEGIETENMVKQFAELECEYIQGYFYSKPIPRADFVAFITQANGLP